MSHQVVQNSPQHIETGRYDVVETSNGKLEAALQWSSRHQREALARSYEILAEIALDRRFDGTSAWLRANWLRWSGEKLWREWLWKTISGERCDVAERINAEVARVCDLAEGRKVRVVFIEQGLINPSGKKIKYRKVTRINRVPPPVST